MKKFLLSLLLLIGFVNFSYGMQLPSSSWNGNHIYNGIFDYYGEFITFSSSTEVNFDYPDLSFVCFKRGVPGNSAKYSLDGDIWYDAFNGEIGCVGASDTVYFKDGQIMFSYFIYGDGYIQPLMTSSLCQSSFNLMPVSDYTSYNCQSDFGLIPVSSVDSNYCEINNLCSSGDSNGSCNDPGSVSWSSLYINNLQYPGNSNIFVNIPDNFDYSYSNSGNDIDIDIAYNVDPDYVQSIIDINSYRPTSEDFTDTFVSGFTLIMPYIVIVLFIIFVWKLLKKIFR